MSKHKSIKILIRLLTFFQIITILIPIVLENFATKKMGVARFLIYKKSVFESSYFTPSLMDLYLVILILGGMISLFVTVLNIKCKKNYSVSLGALVANLIGVIFLQFSFDLASYHFFLIAIMVVIVIQYIKLFTIRLI